MHDLIIIGGGPAGSAAGAYAARKRGGGIIKVSAYKGIEIRQNKNRGYYRRCRAKMLGFNLL